MRWRRIIFLALVVAAIADVTANARSRFAQTAKATLAGIGAVRVEALETPGSVPMLQVRDEVSRQQLFSTKVGADNPDSYTIWSGREMRFSKPRMRFSVVPGDKPGTQFIVAIAISPGGSDCAYEGVVVGASGGKVRLLTTSPVETLAEGGIYVGDLGGQSGYGMAVWKFLWEDEAHLAAHRYAVTLYKFEPTTGEFVRFTKLESKRKYDTGEEALRELGLHYRDLIRGHSALSC